MTSRAPGPGDKGDPEDPIPSGVPGVHVVCSYFGSPRGLFVDVDDPLDPPLSNLPLRRGVFTWSGWHVVFHSGSRS
jgi:hypothetical protein